MSINTFSLDEVAQSLGCTSRWLAEQVRAGHFPAHRIARHWRFTEANVEKIFAVCVNGFSQPNDTTTASVPTVTSMASGLTARSRKRVAG